MSKTDTLNSRRLSPFYEIGFHGDNYLIDFVSGCLNSAQQFIETGANVGSTLYFVAKAFPNLYVYSCEPDEPSYTFALNKTSDFNNVVLKNELSPVFLYNIAKSTPETLDKDTVFWLDSHGYGFKWPLKEEIEFITHNFKSFYIFIDDFLVPNNPQFNYDVYEHQTCSFEYIKDALNNKLHYNIYYPCYREKTSQHHPLKGWILIEYGHTTPVAVPDILKDKIIVSFF